MPSLASGWTMNNPCAPRGTSPRRRRKWRRTPRRASPPATGFSMRGFFEASLPKHDRLVNQIVALERRVTRAGKDSIDHGPHGHDDLANCVAGVADAIRKPAYNLDGLCSNAGDERPPAPPGWQLAGFKSEAEAEAFKARYRAQYGRTASFPWG